MAWRNLRSEISEMFSDYSRGEELSEYVQGLIAKRKANAHNYERHKAYRAKHPEKVKQWNRNYYARLQQRLLESEPECLCRHCWNPFRRQQIGQSRAYCSRTCRVASRREWQTKYRQLYPEKAAAAVRRWHQAHKQDEKLKAQKKAISRRYRVNLQQDPERHAKAKESQRTRWQRYRAKFTDEEWRERERERQNKIYAANPETYRAKARAHYQRKKQREAQP